MLFYKKQSAPLVYFSSVVRLLHTTEELIMNKITEKFMGLKNSGSTLVILGFLDAFDYVSSIMEVVQCLEVGIGWSSCP